MIWFRLLMANPSISVNQLRSKVKSKKELYNFLLQDGQAYLPPLTSTNVYFLKQIINGNKDVRYHLYRLDNLLVYPKG
jgi:hypothetical protein